MSISLVSSSESSPLKGEIRDFVIERVHSLAGEGKDYIEIAKMLGASKRTFTRWRKRDSAIEIAYREGSMNMPLGGLCRVEHARVPKAIGRKGTIPDTQEGDAVAKARDLTGIKQDGYGKLTAVRQVGTHPKQGAIWLCRCECGGSIEVQARLFLDASRKHGVYACDGCKSSGRVAQAEVARVGLGNEWRTPDFESTWLTLLEGMNGAQRLLYETICDGRTGQSEDDYDDYEGEFQVQMEALDISLHCEDIADELKTFGTDRVTRARQRMQMEEADETVN